MSSAVFTRQTGNINGPVDQTHQERIFGLFATSWVLVLLLFLATRSGLFAKQRSLSGVRWATGSGLGRRTQPAAICACAAAADRKSRGRERGARCNFLLRHYFRLADNVEYLGVEWRARNQRAHFTGPCAAWPTFLSCYVTEGCLTDCYSSGPCVYGPQRTFHLTSLKGKAQLHSGCSARLVLKAQVSLAAGVV